MSDKIANKATAPDYQQWDEVRMFTVPRFKESELSGDEWRISATVQLFKKGQCVYELSFGDIDSAIRYLDGALVYRIESGEEQPIRIDYSDYCDQEGCNEKATVAYKRIKQFNSNGVEERNYDWRAIRTFCNYHKTRGDCSLDDSDQNYIEIPFEDALNQKDKSVLGN